MCHARHSAPAILAARLSLLAVLMAAVLLSPIRVLAADIGDVHGVVHDAQHRPVAAAGVQLKAAASAWSRSTQSDGNGEFSFPGVPLGDYVLDRKSVV